MPHNAMQIRYITHLGRPTKILTIQLSCTDQWDTITRAAIATYEMHELVDGSASKKSDLLYIELGLGGNTLTHTYKEGHKVPLFLTHVHEVFQ